MVAACCRHYTVSRDRVMLFAILVLLLVSIVLPLASAWRVWRLDAPSRIAWLLVVGEAAALVALVFLVGRWDMAGVGTRWLLGVAFVAAVLRSLVRHRARPWRATGPGLAGQRATLASLVLLGAALAYAVAGMVPPSGAHDLAFPLAGGRFYIAHGGGNRLVNHHAGHAVQRHAVDINALGPAGFRARGLLPDELNAYAVHGTPVLSPCDGRVVLALDSLPDQVPPRMDAGHPAGNHVVIGCDGLAVELAHLARGSVQVVAGQAVSTGDAVGRVGNSGHSSEPHLHVHAVDSSSGRAVPLRFDGRYPTRNRVFRAPALASGGAAARR